MKFVYGEGFFFFFSRVSEDRGGSRRSGGRGECSCSNQSVKFDLENDVDEIYGYLFARDIYWRERVFGSVSML